VAAIGRKPEVSAAGQERSGSKMGSLLPARPTHSVATAAAVPIDQAPKATPPESGWESLIVVEETESLAEPPLASSKSGRELGWLWPWAVAVVVACAFVAVWFGVDPRIKSQIATVSSSATVGETVAGNVPTASKGATKTQALKQHGLADAPNPPAPAVGPPRSSNRTDPIAEAGSRNTPSRTAKATQDPESVESGHGSNKKFTDERDLLGIRGITILPAITRLADPKAVQPLEGFWPSLAPDNLEEWQIADPGHITMNEDGVSVEAGPRGNILITRDGSYKKCTLSITLAARQGTDAFLVLRARRGAQGWQAITARVYEEQGKVRAGHQSIDFQMTETGNGRKEFAPDKFFVMKFQVNDKSDARVTVMKETTSSTNHDGDPVERVDGAVGLFVKSGRIVIKTMDVQDN